MNNILFSKNIDTDTLKGRCVIIDGKSCKNSKDFFEEIWNGLSFPDINNQNWDAYLDWIRDLSWLEDNTINIIINNYDDFLSDEPSCKTYFLQDINDVVIPYWSNKSSKAKNHKNLMFFCVV